MIVLLAFAFISGLITIFAPCIWPLLPIILSSGATGGHRKAFGITLGLMFSFAIFTLTLSYIVSIIPFDPNNLRFVAVVIIGFLGLTLLIPKLSQLLEGYVSRFSGKVGMQQGQKDSFSSGLITGATLGIIWTPCAGPILATIATLAATQAVNFQLVLVTLAYVTGVGIPLFLFTILGQRIFTRTRALNKYTGRLQQVFGLIMILTALAIATNYDKVLQVKLLDTFPSYAQFVNDLESNDSVQTELNKLKGNTKTDAEMRFPSSKGALKNFGAAPELTGISGYLNTDGQPITLAELKGKVVLIDFWTYTCINCIRTLPHVTSWYENYKDAGFVVVGVHTPEFVFERNRENVQAAIDQYDITYPVVQDNEYETWNAYENRYWPAHYLIDAEGNIRYVHFGEGNYDVTENAIRTLLEEAGNVVSQSMTDNPDQTPRSEQTPETYLGYARARYFADSTQFKSGTNQYSYPSEIPVNTFAYTGTWTVEDEFSRAGEGAHMKMHFYAGDVFLVIHPPAGKTVEVRVMLDGKEISAADAGADVKDGIITVSQPDLYEIVKIEGERSNHILELKFLDEGAEVYAFTFG